MDEVKRYRASGLKAAEYAASRGLHAGTLCGWASKLGKGAEAEREVPRFVPVRVGGGSWPARQAGCFGTAESLR